MSEIPLPNLVGRQRELAGVGRPAFWSALGSVRGVRDSGEAGIGKSVLLRCGAAKLKAVAVARAQGIEADAELPHASRAARAIRRPHTRPVAPRPSNARRSGGSLLCACDRPGDRSHDRRPVRSRSRPSPAGPVACPNLIRTKSKRRGRAAAARRRGAVRGRRFATRHGIYLEAISSAVFAGRAHDRHGEHATAVATRASGAPPSDSEASDLVLDGVATLLAEGRTAGVPVMRRAFEPFVDEVLTCPQRDDVLAARGSGGPGGPLPPAVGLSHLGCAVLPGGSGGTRGRCLEHVVSRPDVRRRVDFHRGDLLGAAGRIEEGHAISAATGHAH